ncbi:hypothetical protein [Halorientalis salina]|uniref:hypothetical protein n=1 Tax=Halorientalis salina TaxID=2932266 RepID=UPI0010AC3190|nr:hypothetical protein [Halorientalis salina]
MKRRNLLAGMGGLAAGSGLLVGTGAFTSVSADRTVTVAVEEDSDALLKLQELGTGKRSVTDGGKLELNIPSDDEGQYPSGDPTDPDGVAPDSVYKFGADAGGNPGDGLFKVINQGTQPVDVYGTNGSDADEPSVAIFDPETDEKEILTESDPYKSLGVGSTLRCGVQLDTHDVSVNTYDVPLIINADADN